MNAPVIILSGPSGSGKSTVVSRLMAQSGLPLRQTVSVTTRPPRAGEKDGVHYHFWSRPRFLREVEGGGFLEWAEVFGNLYGTPCSEVEPFVRQGTGVILVIDVQGAAQVRERCPGALTIFLRTSCWQEYERRLRRRGQEDEAAISRRLSGARDELERAADYDYQILNDDLDAAVSDLQAVVSQAFERKSHAR